MKVKFTNPSRFGQDKNGRPILNPFFDPASDGPTVLVGQLIRAKVAEGTVVVEYSISAMRYELEVDPAADFNFQFIQNTDSDLKYDLVLGQRVEELELLDKQARRSK